MTMLRHLLLVLLLLPGMVHATERIVMLEDGSTVKVFLFYPKNHGEGPWPLTVLMSGGTANEYIARAQFWLGHELANRGWAIALPVSPDSNSFFGRNATKIPGVIRQLQLEPGIEPGRTLLVGVSNGGSSAIEIASRDPEKYYGVVAVPGIIKDDASLGDFRNLPVFVRIGENDYLDWDSQLPALQDKLTRAGARVNAKLQDEASHVFPINWDELQPWLDALR